MFKRNKSPQGRKIRGLTLIEALLFLGIAAVVVIGAVAFYNTASNQQKMGQAQTQIQSYVSGIKTLYATRTNFSNVSDQLVIVSGKAPDNAIDASGSTPVLINPWGGSTTIAGAARTFDITMTSVPRDACTGILAAGMLDNGSIIQIQVNTGSAGLFTANPDPAATITACNAANNTMTFRAR